MKFTYKIEAEARSLKDEDTLRKMGFEKDWDQSPFTLSFTEEERNVIMDTAIEIDEVSSMIWTITKREEK